MEKDLQKPPGQNDEWILDYIAVEKYQKTI